MSKPDGASIHANVVVVGEAGVLIRGPSGAGKSQLSLALVDEAHARGRYGALVADDRTFLSAEHGRLIARGAPGFEGLIEQRGEGLIRLGFEPSTVVRLVVDLPRRGAVAPRWPEEEARSDDMLGVALPRLAADLSMGVIHAARLTLRKLAFDSPENVRQLVISLDHRAAVHKNVTGA
jgi:serine kinase of HPr protein (carbohydrate metabolism regulator)